MGQYLSPRALADSQVLGAAIWEEGALRILAYVSNPEGVSGTSDTHNKPRLLSSFISLQLSAWQCLYDVLCIPIELNIRLGRGI